MLCQHNLTLPPTLQACSFLGCLDSDHKRHGYFAQSKQKGQPFTLRRWNVGREESGESCVWKRAWSPIPRVDQVYVLQGSFGSVYHTGQLQFEKKKLRK